IKFKAPVKVGDTVLAKVTVTEIQPEKRRVHLKTECLIGETLIIDGDAVVMVDSKASATS
ncbi:MAG: (R)-hydratase, partial [Alphaproteobacteria bacterium]